MASRTWVIVGATSVIAEQFAQLAATAKHDIHLVGRNIEQLDLIARDITIRYKVFCGFSVYDLSCAKHDFTELFAKYAELDLFIAHSDFTENNDLTEYKISRLIQTNVISTIQLIYLYFEKKQSQHQLIFLSSVAAARGRNKNSLYGASKACVELFLEGLQQNTSANQHITIARLGYIDTKHTVSQKHLFYVAPAANCAQACWNALKKKKHFIYFPFFWRFIIWGICCLPQGLFKKMGQFE